MLDDFSPQQVLGLAAPLGTLDIGMLVLKYLAVAGGFAAGGIGSGLLLRGIARITTTRALPRPMLRIVQLLGGVALGLVVYVWAPGGGGFGSGSGGGLGLGGASQSSASHSESSEQNRTTVTSLTNPQPTASAVMRVVLLGGDLVHDQRYYQIPGSKGPLNLLELEQALEARQKDTELPAIKSVEIVIYEDSVAQQHPAVRELERWARQNNLEVRLSKPPGKIP